MNGYRCYLTVTERSLLQELIKRDLKECKNWLPDVRVKCRHRILEKFEDLDPDNLTELKE